MKLVACSAALVAVVCSPVAARAEGEDGAVQAGYSGPRDLARLSLEELAEIEVTSVSLRAESLADAAASVFVIGSDDIRRSGAASLPEALRLAPNLNVQRINASDYAITARGFNGYETANKLLVLIDGRSVYSTLHSGVFWETLGVALEDIERIEVISGPGGSLYGANAVNGVINVITRSAQTTRGPALAISAGEEDRTITARLGGDLGADGGWRLYVRGFERGDTLLPAGAQGASDQSHGFRTGLRLDWRTGADRWTFEGDGYEHEVVAGNGTSDAVASGGFAQVRWARDLDGGGGLQAGVYHMVDYLDYGFTRERQYRTDLRAQYAFTRGRHALVLGGNYRLNNSRLTTVFPTGLDPTQRDIRLAALFAQDQIAITPDLTLTLGAKVEQDSFSGTHVLPNARLAWRLGGEDLVWASASRAVRTPSRIDRDLFAPGFLEAGGFQSEELTAYELGYRGAPLDRFNLSVSLFYNEYEKLRTVSATPPALLPLRFTNLGEGSTWGGELWAAFDVGPRWRLKAGANVLEKDLSSPPSDITGLISQGDDPGHEFLLVSQAQLTDDVAFDVQLRHQGRLDASNLPAYTEADARLGWRLRPDIELALVGRNLLDASHQESADPQRGRLIERSIHLQLRTGF